jgi:carbon-monoxide dehydrogenase medium subunit
VKPPPFAYRSPRSLAEAVETLAEAGSDGKVLAGGQSLIPLLNMRLAAPKVLVDINRLPDLDRIDSSAQGVRLGALVRHSAALRAAPHPLLTQALRHVAHPVIRNRGTVVGSLAHADPAAEVPAVLAVLRGFVSVVSSEGERPVPAAEFFVGPLESALRPGEVAVSAFFPALGPREGTAFAEVARRHGDYALVGAAGLVRLDDDLRVFEARVGYLSVAATPVVLDLTETLDHRPPDSCDWPAAAAEARESLEPDADIHASAGYRRHLVGVLTERVLREAAAHAMEG